MNMKCREIDRLLIEYHEDALSPDRKKQVKEHLVSCEGCRLRLEEIQHAYKLLAKDETPQPDENFWVNFLPQVRSRIEAKEGQKAIFRPGVRWAIGFASVLLVVIVGSLLFTKDDQILVQQEEQQLLETTLALSNPYTYADQLVEVLTTQGAESLPVEVLLSNGGTNQLELAAEVLDEDYLNQTDLNSILGELNLEELKQLEDNVRTLNVADIL
jgi:predicted anti-sigma-YlaC factor YlaD